MSLHIKGVLFLIVALGTVSVPVYRLGGQFAFRRHQQITADIRDLDLALRNHVRVRGEYPSSLQVLVEQGELQRLPADPWKQAYVYRVSAARSPHGFDLFSAGPDGIPDTADDDWGGTE